MFIVLFTKKCTQNVPTSLVLEKYFLQYLVFKTQTKMRFGSKVPETGPLNFWHVRVWICHRLVLWYLWCFRTSKMYFRSHNDKVEYTEVRLSTIPLALTCGPNLVAFYVPCELMGTPMYHMICDFENLFVRSLERQQPFDSIPPLMECWIIFVPSPNVVLSIYLTINVR